MMKNVKSKQIIKTKNNKKQNKNQQKNPQIYKQNKIPPKYKTKTLKKEGNGM